jgi:hypothetical protein
MKINLPENGKGAKYHTHTNYYIYYLNGKYLLSLLSWFIHLFTCHNSLWIFAQFNIYNSCRNMLSVILIQTQHHELQLLMKAYISFSYLYFNKYWVAWKNGSVMTWIFFFRNQDNIVGIVTGIRLDDRGVGVRIPLGSRIFSSARRPDRLWGPPNLSNGYQVLFPQG